VGLCTIHYSYITVFILCHLHRRITDNVLELVEESLDINLTGNHLELQFTDGILLPVVYIFESHTHISVLAATTNSVHRIVFSHPERLRRHVSLPLFILVHLCCDCLCKFEVTCVMGLVKPPLTAHNPCSTMATFFCPGEQFIHSLLF